MNKDAINTFQNDSVTIELNLSQDTAKRGDEVTLSLTLNIASGDHVYAFVPAGKAYMPIMLSLKLPAGVEAINDWQIPTGDFYFEDPEIMIYQNEVQFTHQLQVSQSSTTPINVAAEIKFQSCNAMACSMPENVSLAKALTIV